jgi:hypothetical protein
MSANRPPNPYFNGINFNRSFFSTVVLNSLTEAIANTKYLLLSGANYMAGNLGIKQAPMVELDVNGRAYINNNLIGPPTPGIYGGNSTRLIISQGDVGEYPSSLGVDNFIMWYGTQTLGSHIFYTGITEKLRISPLSITVGSGTNFNMGNGSANTYLTLSTGASPAILGTASTPYQHSTSAAIGDTVLRSQQANKLLSQADSAGAAMTIIDTGNIGIGIGAPASKLQIHTNQPSIEVKLQISDGTTGAGSTNGCAIIKTSSEEMFITNYQATRMVFANNNLNVITISSLGAVCIGQTNATQILQVADGGRLRISNGSGDYTSIGTRDIFDDNNTRIEISGNTRATNTGAIIYKSTTALGFHSFLTNGTYQNVRIIQDDFQINTSCSTYGFNYYTDGEYAIRTQKISAFDRSIVTGYFVYCGDFFSSMVNIMVSHTSTSYTYWAGHIITNNTTQPISLNAINSSNMSISSFWEQTSLKWWLVFVPTVSYNANDQLRIKFYG